VIYRGLFHQQNSLAQ